MTATHLVMILKTNQRLLGERMYLLRVMDAHGIAADLRDSFVEHAVNFDLDDNGYLKKAELEEAAKAWNSENSSEDEEVENR